MITIHKASFVSEPRKQQQHRSSLPTCTKHIPANCHTNEQKKIGIINTKAPRMTRLHSIDIIKPYQNVHLREQCLGSTCSVYMPNRSKPVTDPHLYNFCFSILMGAREAEAGIVCSPASCTITYLCSARGKPCYPGRGCTVV